MVAENSLDGTTLETGLRGSKEVLLVFERMDMLRQSFVL